MQHRFREDKQYFMSTECVAVMRYCDYLHQAFVLPGVCSDKSSLHAENASSRTTSENKRSIKCSERAISIAPTAPCKHRAQSVGSIRKVTRADYHLPAGNEGCRGKAGGKVLLASSAARELQGQAGGSFVAVLVQCIATLR